MKTLLAAVTVVALLAGQGLGVINVKLTSTSTSLVPGQSTTISILAQGAQAGLFTLAGSVTASGQPNVLQSLGGTFGWKANFIPYKGSPDLGSPMPNGAWNAFGSIQTQDPPDPTFAQAALTEVASYQIKALAAGTVTLKFQPDTNYISMFAPCMETDGSEDIGTLTSLTITVTAGGGSPPTAQSASVSVLTNTSQTVTLQASDDGLPSGTLNYIITTTPAHGSLVDPYNGATITAFPYTLLNRGSSVRYIPANGYAGADSFPFKANDGGTPPSGGDSNIATISVSVGSPPVAYSYENAATGLVPALIYLSAVDDGRPNPPGYLTFRITRLPAHGTLKTYSGTSITSTSYTFTDSRVYYTAVARYGGNDSFDYVANDGGTAPGGGDSNLATISLPVTAAVYYAGMDTNPGWTLDSGWSWGTPSGGGSHGHDPTSGYTGSSVIGYNLSGDYANSILTARYATTPAIDCRGLIWTTLKFQRWLGVDAPALDHANIQVSNDGTTWKTVWCQSSVVSDSGWQAQQYSISGVADGQQTVYIRWGMGPTDAAGTYPGWNIDDVVVTGTYDTRPITAGGQYFANSGQPCTIHLGVWDDGQWDASWVSCIITSLPAHGTLSDPGAGPITSASLPYTVVGRGKYVIYTSTPGWTGTDMFFNKVNDGGTPPTGGDSASTTFTQINVENVIYLADMNTDPGWTLGAGWSYGTLTGGGFNNQDPTSAVLGNKVIGYNIGGDYANSMAESDATTSAIDCRGYSNVKLRLARWLGVVGTDAAGIWVSNNGTTWTNVWAYPQDPAGAVFDFSWAWLVYDISAVANNQRTVYVRFSMGPTDAAETASGWNLDEVRLVGTLMPNTAPTANAGPDQTVTLPASASLVGSASDDGLPVSPGSLAYTWSKVSGPGTVTFADTGSLTTTAGFSVDGTYVLQLDVFDGALTGSDTVTITVNPRPNANPTVDAGADIAFVYENRPVSLHAVASDPDGDPLTYAWTQTAGQAVVSPSGGTTADYSFTTPVLATQAGAAMTFQATISDGQGGSASDSVNVQVRAAGDASGDGIVNVSDLQALVTAWAGSAGGPADFNGDGLVNVGDLQVLVANWGRSL